MFITVWGLFNMARRSARSWKSQNGSPDTPAGTGTAGTIAVQARIARAARWPNTVPARQKHCREYSALARNRDGQRPVHRGPAIGRQPRQARPADFAAALERPT